MPSRIEICFWYFVAGANANDFEVPFSVLPILKS
jgi:hypothetical protein